jgi:hypothetical protein
LKLIVFDFLKPLNNATIQLNSRKYEKTRVKRQTFKNSKNGIGKPKSGQKNWIGRS